MHVNRIPGFIRSLSAAGISRCRSPPSQSDFPHIGFQIGEKTVFDNTNPYTLRTECAEGITHYYISFTDGQANHRETEVSRPVYLEFCRFVKQERNLRRWDERHTEYSELTEETLMRRSLRPPKGVEEAVFDGQRDKRLRQAIEELPELQRRRFVLYHEFGLTYGQIAQMEGCSKMSAKRAVDRAEEKIREELKNF
ncbi:MAG: sigma-70 family RNA polymerase sigma factor [Coriobacteriales bacterium]|jgi:RNA polymerase sigma-70 factor (ECF subfamily)|nr:sigma-70 family RNA polymerase sigma factor [Coriobacteriales bacterium]